MNYHVVDGIISESGQVFIFTTNQNQKQLLVDGTVSFAGPVPTVSVTSASVATNPNDLLVVGQCTDTICFIPVGVSEGVR